MGAPMVGFYCAKPPVPSFLINLLIVLSHINRTVVWSLRTIGLGFLLHDVMSFRAHAAPSTSPTADANHLQPPQPRSCGAAGPLSATALIRQALPASRYEPLPRKDGHSNSGPNPAADSCAVCLHGLQAGDVVRRLGACLHVFHATCIDPWVDIGRRTCPLCRAQLVPQEMLREAMMIAAGGQETCPVMTPRT